MTDQLDWLRRVHRRKMVGFHIPDYDQLPEYSQLRKRHGMSDILGEFDPHAFIRAVRDAKVQLFWFYSKCHFGNAYYPTKVGHMHSALKGRDIFGEMVAACEQEGVIPGCVYECSDYRVVKDKPEWCHRIPSDPGMTQGDTTDATQGTRVGGPCLNGPYGEFMIEQAREVLKEYPIKGWYFDFLGLFGFDAWRCPYCGPKLKRETGIEFERAESLTHDEYVAYTRWWYAQADDYAKKIMAVMRDLRPDVAIIHNCHALADKVAQQRMDFVGENGDFVGGDSFQLRSGMLQMSWKHRVYGSHSRVPPGEALLDSMACVALDFSTLKGLDGFNAELWTTRCCNTAVCTSIGMNIDGTFDPQPFEMDRKIFSEHEPYDKWFNDMEPVANVGLVRSHDATEFRREPETSLIEQPWHAAEFEGWAQALIVDHQLWDVVWAHQLTDERLAKLKTLILPNVSCMSEAECAAVRRFVKNGGALIATGETSLCDSDGHELENFQLAHVFGADFDSGRNLERRQASIDAPELQASEPWVSRMLTFANGQIAVQLRSGAEELGRIYNKPQISLINIFAPTELPAFVRNRFGEGRCTYFASAAGLHYRHFGQSNILRLMRNVLADCVGDAGPVRLVAPGTVELFAHRQTGMNHLVVNLVNCVAGVTRTAGQAQYRRWKMHNSDMRFEDIDEMPPIPEVTLVFPDGEQGPPQRIMLVPDGQELPIERADGGCRVTLRDIRVHVTVVAEY